MAFEAATAARLRADLGGRAGLAERPMFGGLAFLLGGHMVRGCYRDRAMFRVGKAAMAEALALADVDRMRMGERVMGGFVEAGPEAVADDARRGRLLRLALDFVATLPPKEPAGLSP